jgi:hypothetical protein
LGEVGIDVGAAVGIDDGMEVGAAVGIDVGMRVGAAVGVDVGLTVGAEVGSLTLSETSSKSGEFNSTTVYTPGITWENSNTPFESVEVLATTVPLVKRYSTTTPLRGRSPMVPFLVTSNTTPLIVHNGSSTKSIPVELVPTPRSATMVLSLAPETSETDT